MITKLIIIILCELINESYSLAKLGRFTQPIYKPDPTFHPEEIYNTDPLFQREAIFEGGPESPPQNYLGGDTLYGSGPIQTKDTFLTNDNFAQLPQVILPPIPNGPMYNPGIQNEGFAQSQPIIPTNPVLENQAIVSGEPIFPGGSIRREQSAIQQDPFASSQFNWPSNSPASSAVRDYAETDVQDGCNQVQRPSYSRQSVPSGRTGYKKFSVHRKSSMAPCGAYRCSRNNYCECNGGKYSSSSIQGHRQMHPTNMEPRHSQYRSSSRGRPRDRKSGRSPCRNCPPFPNSFPVDKISSLCK